MCTHKTDCLAIVTGNFVLFAKISENVHPTKMNRYRHYILTVVVVLI